MEDIYISDEKTKYQIDPKTGLVQCKATLVLSIFGETKVFHGEGYSHCTKENIFNESFGKALATIRAGTDIGRQIETSLVKYSFDHFVKPINSEKELDERLLKLVKEFVAAMRRI